MMTRPVEEKNEVPSSSQEPQRASGGRDVETSILWEHRSSTQPTRTSPGAGELLYQPEGRREAEQCSQVREGPEGRAQKSGLYLRGFI